MLNLLLNAVHAIGRQGVITVGAETREHGQGCWIWVEDDGPGIEEGFRAWRTMVDGLMWPARRPAAGAAAGSPSGCRR